MCVGCRARAPQASLLRLASGPGGTLQRVDRRAHTGRSAYLHRSPECWERFAQRKGLVRSLGCNVDKGSRRAFLEELKPGEQSAMMR
ncbi:MAG: YlxR family protein [Candidatus Binatia bacterium]